MSLIVDLLLRDPIFSKFDPVSLSLLLPYLEERHYAIGESLYRIDQAAQGMYLVVSGEGYLRTHEGEICASGCTRFGEESATDARHYLADAIAATPLTAIYIPRESLVPLLATQPVLKSEFMFALMHHLTTKRPEVVESAPHTKQKSSGIIALTGWIATLVLPIVVLLLGNQYGIERNNAMFLAIFTATMIMWVFSLTEDFIPGLFAIMAILIAGLVPATVILSGFASDSFLMAMSVLSLSAVIVSSGLSYRAMLLLLKYLPNSRLGHNFGIFMTGFLLTPLIPSANGRLALLLPFYVDMVQNLRFKRQGEAATQLVVSVFSGVSLFSAMFLSSKTANFAVLSMLPMQTQDHFQGFKWLMASGVVALVLLAVYVFSTAWLFRSMEKPQLSKACVASQLQLLGKMQQREWAALLGIVVFVLGLLTASLHHIAPPWLGLMILYGLLLFGSLSKREFKEKVDWTFLLYMSGLAGLISSFNYLGLDRTLASFLPGLGITMRDNFSLFVLILFGLIFVIRLVVPINATIVILATLFVPLADVYGVNPWVVGFMILLLGEIWFLPYQCSYYRQLQAINRDNPLFKETSFLLQNGLMNFAKLAAIYTSIPYWKSMGLL